METTSEGCWSLPFFSPPLCLIGGWTTEEGPRAASPLCVARTNSSTLHSHWCTKTKRKRTSIFVVLIGSRSHLHLPQRFVIVFKKQGLPFFASPREGVDDVTDARRHSRGKAELKSPENSVFIFTHTLPSSSSSLDFCCRTWRTIQTYTLAATCRRPHLQRSSSRSAASTLLCLDPCLVFLLQLLMLIQTLSAPIFILCLLGTFPIGMPSPKAIRECFSFSLIITQEGGALNRML